MKKSVSLIHEEQGLAKPEHLLIFYCLTLSYKYIILGNVSVHLKVSDMMRPKQFCAIWLQIFDRKPSSSEFAFLNAANSGR